MSADFVLLVVAPESDVAAVAALAVVDAAGVVAAGVVGVIPDESAFAAVCFAAVACFVAVACRALDVVSCCADSDAETAAGDLAG
ncbi:MAG: hypothetical protein ACREOJ_10095 [Gemmatimonadaceae bacterium]